MESLNPELALYGSKHECDRTNTVLSLISEVSTWAVSLKKTVYALEYPKACVI